ncbi:Methionine--tRNA ligase, cytoplasmic [Hondaea fermentalgiana]|uniref:Methionine--tRNA ligase, cytoplasmic n=1 Tax=Hondaea fermentalgiana TaxID=2315210 RepID=A0A2R5GS00_9STRA|nr:Methionine--tRNA ligase, cytoplasmic [Hondaea fermentalgiana]|eukprot:GBG31121.1 Methionine--tRNA ligase, cytoplasmic [Hondaea fermentalgiana]
MAAAGELQFVAGVVARAGASGAAAVADAARKAASLPNAQLRAVVEAAGGAPEAQRRWLGAGAEEQARVAQWLSVKSKEVVDGDEKSVQKVLEALDGCLQTQSFVASPLYPSLADLALFWALRTSFQPKSSDSVPAACRWFNSLQLDESVQAAAGQDLKQVKFAVPDVWSKLPNGAAGSSAPPAKVARGDADKDAKKGAEKPDSKNNKNKKEAKGGAKDAKPAKDGKKKGNNAPAPADDQPIITKMDIRVGKIVKCWNHEASDHLFCETIDVGEEEPRPIASGLRSFYSSPSDLEGRLCLVLCNLKARKLGGYLSNGMVLCASNADKTQVEVVDPPAGAEIGERVVFQGIEGGPFEPATPAQVAKKKIFEAVAPNLKTTADRNPCWLGQDGKVHLFTTSKGPCSVPTIANGIVS